MKLIDVVNSILAIGRTTPSAGIMDGRRCTKWAEHWLFPAFASQLWAQCNRTQAPALLTFPRHDGHALELWSWMSPFALTLLLSGHFVTTGKETKTTFPVIEMNAFRNSTRYWHHSYKSRRAGERESGRAGEWEKATSMCRVAHQESRWGYKWLSLPGKYRSPRVLSRDRSWLCRVFWSLSCLQEQHIQRVLFKVQMS